MKLVRHQQGLTLVTALIMLVLLTLLALTSFNLGNSTLQVVGNMQQREQSVAAANEAIEETISSTNFFNTPAAALPHPDGAPNQRLVDIDADGKADIKVTISPPPSCVKAQVIKNSDLRLEDAEDAGCSVGTAQNFGVAGASDGNSDCANSVWDVSAVATDMATKASVKVTQGVAVRVAKDDIATNCPQSGASQ
jgi:hypothetical protein